jgi:hypothetical protein
MRLRRPPLRPDFENAAGDVLFPIWSRTGWGWVTTQRWISKAAALVANHVWIQCRCGRKIWVRVEFCGAQRDSTLNAWRDDARWLIRRLG